jgi:hypothetical protein
MAPIMHKFSAVAKKMLFIDAIWDKFALYLVQIWHYNFYFKVCRNWTFYDLNQGIDSKKNIYVPRPLPLLVSEEEEKIISYFGSYKTADIPHNLLHYNIFMVEFLTYVLFLIPITCWNVYRKGTK